MPAILIIILFSFTALTGLNGQSNSGINEGIYQNPIIHADFSDPDVIRTGKNYFMTASSFVHTPGLPILHSKDLVHWTIVNYAVENLDYGDFSKPMHGGGIWAPCIRYHNNEYYIYFGDPDYGLFMTKTKNPFGKWEPLRLIKEAKGWIDPSPLWDEDGNAYLVHAWARSRSGIKHRLTLHKMSIDGASLLDDGTTIYEDSLKHPTLEGPKFYKRNGYYYILAPAGGVPTGWQAAFRSKNIYGPYDDKIVMEQGSTIINGPHQGGLVDTKTGENWFIHFQDKGAYGRIVHLQPVIWKNDWPVIGAPNGKEYCSEPVESFKFPYSDVNTSFAKIQTSDDFDSGKIGLQWQWEANHKNEWYSLTESKGTLRLYSVKKGNDTLRIWDLPNVIAQKFPYEAFTATAKIDFSAMCEGEKTGMVILGSDYISLGVLRNNAKNRITFTKCEDAHKNGKEEITIIEEISANSVYFKLDVSKEAICSFSYSVDGISFKNSGKSFKAKKGVWVGTKIGFFSSAPSRPGKTGFSDIDYLRFTELP